MVRWIGLNCQCHTPNDGIPPRTSVFEARWFVTSQITKFHIQDIQDSIPIYKAKGSLTSLASF